MMLSLNPIAADVLFPTVESFMWSFVIFIVQEVHKFIIFTDSSLMYHKLELWRLRPRT